MSVSFLKLAGYVAKLPRNTRNILQTCLYGVAGGLAVVAFQWLINFLYDHTFIPLSAQSHLTFVLGSFGVMVGSALVVGILLRYCPEAAGSGIPQAKAAFWKDFGVIPWRPVWVKFVAGILAIGGGGSLGREGPSVHIASGLSSTLAGLTGEAKQNRRRATASGAAIGVAAAFNAPLSAMAFTLEEIIQDLNSNLLGSVVVASVIAALIVHGLIGRQPAFAMRTIGAPTWRAYVLTPLAAVVASVAGAWFQRFTLALRARQRGWSKIPVWLKPATGAALAWVLGTSVFLFTGHLGVFSLGYGDLTQGLDNRLVWDNHMAWELAGILLVAKLLATVLSYGFGGCGGIFSPTLFFGGMSGLLVADVFGMVVPMPGDDSIALAVVGMSACLGAVVRAPVTGILIVFEMTHQFSLVPVLMIGALISQAVGRRMLRENFYDAILEQDGHKLEKLLPPRDLQSWQKLPISAIANFQPVVLNGIEPAPIDKLLKEHAFTHFPVMQDGVPAGIVSRAELAEALVEKRTPKLAPAIRCEPRQTIRELQGLLLDSHTGMAVVCDGPKLLGIVTLHDLLRAQINATQNSV